MTTTTSKLADVLMVEDNPGDSRLAKEAFEEVNADVSLNVVTDGESALSFLRKENGYSDATTPQLIILDLDLPGRNGREILAEIKSDDTLRRIPVIVLTTTDDDATIADLYDNYANAFVTKPESMSKFIDMIGSVQSFWLSNASLPPRNTYE